MTTQVTKRLNDRAQYLYESARAQLTADAVTMYVDNFGMAFAKHGLHLAIIDLDWGLHDVLNDEYASQHDVEAIAAMLRRTGINTIEFITFMTKRHPLISTSKMRNVSMGYVIACDLKGVS